MEKISSVVKKSGHRFIECNKNAFSTIKTCHNIFHSSSAVHCPPSNSVCVCVCIEMATTWSPATQEMYCQRLRKLKRMCILLFHSVVVIRLYFFRNTIKKKLLCCPAFSSIKFKTEPTQGEGIALMGMSICLRYVCASRAPLDPHLLISSSLVTPTSLISRGGLNWRVSALHTCMIHLAIDTHRIYYREAFPDARHCHCVKGHG